ncbi:MAG TPA: hypothetical protein VGD05_06745, partial [Pyrinomonadaceae bacterium]
MLGAAVGFSGRAAPNADNKKFRLNFTELMNRKILQPGFFNNRYFAEGCLGVYCKDGNTGEELAISRNF